MELIVPPHVLHRRKLGFPVPIRHFLAEGSYEWARTIITTAHTEEYLDRAAVLAHAGRAPGRARPTTRRRIWTILVFQIWHGIFVDRADHPGHPATGLPGPALTGHRGRAARPRPRVRPPLGRCRRDLGGGARGRRPRRAAPGATPGPPRTPAGRRSPAPGSPSVTPTCADRSRREAPTRAPARNPARKPSPTPVGSTISRVRDDRDCSALPSCGHDLGCPPRRSVVIRVPTRSRISSSVQPVF